MPREGLWDKQANGCSTSAKNWPYNRPTLSGLPVFQGVTGNGDVGGLRGRYKSEEGYTPDAAIVTQGGASVYCRRLLGTALCAILLSSTRATDVVGQNDPATQSAMTGNEEGSLLSSPETAVETSQGADYPDLGFGQPRYRPQWTVTAEFISLDRVGSFNQTLVETEPSTVPVIDLYDTPGTEVLNATDLHQGFSSGPRFGLIHHGDNDGDLEIVYFQIDGWNAARSTGPDPNDWLVMKAPGGFVQEQDNKDTQMMVWDYSSRLYNAEVNARWNLWSRVTVLAGFRWVNLSEELQGTLPPERTVPFWDTQTKNNLYGFQIGAEGELFERGRFSIGCTGKAGVFDNHAEETTTVSIYRILFGESDSADHVAFVGEVGVQSEYQVTQRLSLRAGYEAIWLQGVALAPGQIQETVTHGSHLPQDIYLQSLGVNCGSGVVFHGATAGLVYSF